MVNTLTQQTTSKIEEIDADVWIPSMPPTDLIFDDGEPLETNQHRVGMNVLIRSYQQYRGTDTDFYVGGNMFVYYSTAQIKNRDFRGPDFFVVLDVDGQRDRLGWVAWEEGGRYPDTVIELMSPSTANVDLGLKKQLYDRIFKTQDYFVYNPFDPNSLKGWHRNSEYKSLSPNSRGWLWCESLGLWLGTWYGTIDRETLTWLRFYDQSGKLVLLPEEAAQQRAEAESQRAEAESQRAETESQRAEAESQRAEAESQRAEAESQRAEAESQRAERLAARLRELGEDPNSF